MNRYQILSSIQDLAKSQGFYGRLYKELKDNEKALTYLEKQNFGDTVDMVMFIES